MVDLKEISEKIEKGQTQKVVDLVKESLGNGISAKDVLTKGLMPGLIELGERFGRDEAYIPEVMLAARAMNAGMELLKPILAESGVEPVGKFVIGTVQDDMHDIGKNIVAMLFEGAGFQVLDLGTDVAPERFVEAIKAEKPDIVGLSALLSTTMGSQEDTIRAMEEAGVRQQVKVVIGGAPVTQGYADKIKADGYAANASAAVEKAKDLLGI